MIQEVVFDLKRKLLFVFLLSVISTSSARADEADTWLASYEDPHGTALKKIELRKNDKGEVKIRVHAAGYPETVDWGEETALVHRQVGGGLPNFVATFSLPKAKELLIVNPNSGSGRPFDGGSVWVELFTTFKDGRQAEVVRQMMVTSRK